MPFDFDALRRFPDVEADNLHAVDASDRLVLDEGTAAIEAAGPIQVAVIGDHYGALALGAVGLHGARGVRVYQDPLSGELALRRNAETLGLADEVASGPLDASLVSDARVVLGQLPRSLDELDELAGVVAGAASPDVVLLLGGRIKHMTRAMNDVLLRHFGEVTASLARQKSRVLVARAPLANAAPSPWPVSRHDAAANLEVVAHGSVFAGARIDVGTRFLLEQIPLMRADARTALDLGCGSGVLAAAAARARPDLRVVATDQSAGAVASARATADANGVGERVDAVRDDAASTVPDGSVDLVMLNPPFHIGNTVHSGIAEKLFAAAGRVLAPGGELWTVWNTPLGYRAALERHVGPTRQVARNAKFTVTVSVPRPHSG